MTAMFGNDGKNTKSFVHPERLPPTLSSIKFHGLRVYYLIMVWMGTDDGMDALEWGGKVDNNQMVPIMTDMKAAPDNLLKMIHCNCKSCPPHCSCRHVLLYNTWSHHVMTLIVYLCLKMIMTLVNYLMTPIHRY